MNANHTPGPWAYIEKCKGTVHVVLGLDDSMICQLHSGKNGSLIAAAPELLEALKAVVPIVAGLDSMREAGEPETPELVAARAAIAKAEGR